MARATQGATSGPAAPSTAPHRQVAVDAGSWSASVDEGLAPLIEGLWVLGIRTRYSCERSTRRINLMRQPRDVAYLMFPDPSDLLRMMALFVDTELDPRQRRSAWTYELFPRYAADAVTGEPVGLHPVVYIPVEQVGTVTDTVRRAAGLAPRAATGGSASGAG